LQITDRAKEVTSAGSILTGKKWQGRPKSVEQAGVLIHAWISAVVFESYGRSAALAASIT